MPLTTVYHGEARKESVPCSRQVGKLAGRGRQAWGLVVPCRSIRHYVLGVYHGLPAADSLQMSSSGPDWQACPRTPSTAPGAPAWHSNHPRDKGQTRGPSSQVQGEGFGKGRASRCTGGSCLEPGPQPGDPWRPTVFSGTDSRSGDEQTVSKALPEVEVRGGLKGPRACLGDGGQLPVAALEGGFGRAQSGEAPVNLGARAGRKKTCLCVEIQEAEHKQVCR